MNILTIDDLNQIFSLAMNAKCERRSVNHIKKFITSRKKSLDNKELTENEIKILSTDHNVEFFMILFFLTENVALEFLRREETPYPYEVVVVKQIWNNNKAWAVKSGSSTNYEFLVDATVKVKITILISRYFKYINKLWLIFN